MAVSETIKRIAIDRLHLDPRNPRLGRHFVGRKPSQSEILETMGDWALEELAVSFVENGFWTQEALVVVDEQIDGTTRTVVVEGNRRLAALKLLRKASEGKKVPPQWNAIAKSTTAQHLRDLWLIPCVQAASRKEVQAYLGFRHVSGIKEWAPAEKAEFIARLITEEGLSYEQVRRRIGSKTPTVRQNFIAYRLLRQMEDEEEIAIDKVEERFSVLYLSLRAAGTQQYLGIKLDLDPKAARRPVPRSRTRQLTNFSRWLFGSGDSEPLVRDSRQIDQFGRILENKKAVDYLERTSRPSFASAYRIAGGDEVETSEHVERAADEIQEALGTAHLHRKSRRLQSAVDRLGRHVRQLLELFPDQAKIMDGEE